MIIDEGERSNLFDIPEDRTVDSCDTASIDSCFFDVADNDDDDNDDPTTTSSTSNNSNTNFTLLQKLSSKFHNNNKSHTEGGADVTALRGIYGADFEGYALMTKRRSKSSNNNMRTLGGLVLAAKKKNNNTAPKQRFLLIKGAFLFVFKDELSPAPKYVIRLAYTKTRVVEKEQEEDVTDLDNSMTTVVMETPTTSDQGDNIEYELVFQREKYANGFAATAIQMATRGEVDSEEIPERLGTCHLLTQSESIRYAEKMAMETMDDHPTDLTPISRGTYLRTPKVH